MTYKTLFEEDLEIAQNVLLSIYKDRIFVDEHIQDYPEDARKIVNIVRAMELAAEARGLERAAAVCQKQGHYFLDPKYAVWQPHSPHSSFSERNACIQCETKIRALKPGEGT